MSDARYVPWSQSPNAPKVLYEVYFYEKIVCSGNLICSILYGANESCPPKSTSPYSLRSFGYPGTLIVLFFKCMTALFNPVYCRGGSVKWGLVSFTVIMFSLATLHTAMDLNLLPISCIDNRDFPGVKGVSSPRPYGYTESIYFKAMNIIPNATFPLNDWLADGLLVSSCFILSSLAQVPDSSSSSSIVVTCSTPQTTGPLSSPASCTLPLCVRI